VETLSTAKQNHIPRRIFQMADLLIKKAPTQARGEAAKILLKHGVALGTFHAQVEASFDCSGSTEMREYGRHFYSKGYMNGVATAVLAMGLNLDDNGNVPAWRWSSDVKELPAITAENLDGYVERYMPARSIDGGTYMSRAMEAMMRGFDPKSKDPGFAMIFTDGEASDKDRVETLLRQYSSKPVFWQFVGLEVPGASTDFGLLEELDNLSGRVVDNANFFRVNVHTVTYEDMWNRLIAEFKGYPNLIAGNSRVHW